MSELEDYKEEKLIEEENVSPPEESPKKKGMSLKAKILIVLMIFFIGFCIFKMSYKPKKPKVLAIVPEPIMDKLQGSYDLKSEVRKFLQKQVEYIM